MLDPIGEEYVGVDQVSKADGGLIELGREVKSGYRDVLDRLVVSIGQSELCRTHVDTEREHGADVEETVKEDLSGRHRALWPDTFCGISLWPRGALGGSAQSQQDPRFLYHHTASDTEVIFHICRDSSLPRGCREDLREGR